MEYREIDPKTLRLEPAEGGGLRASVAGGSFAAVRLRLAFPIGSSRRCVEIRGGDGGLLGFLPSPEGLEPRSRALFEEEVERLRDAVKIERVRSLSSRFGVTFWSVETDRGPRRFELPDRDLIRMFPGRRVFFVDPSGTRYEVPDLGAIDPESRERIEREL